MTTLRALYHLARADMLERVRRSSFLVLVGTTVYLGYLCVPRADASYQSMSLAGARGIYNSPWVGAMFGIVISTLGALVAFYPIKNAVTRDRQTQVGQIIAATSVCRSVYVLGKWLSNVALLTLLLSVMTGMAAVMQLVRAEDLHLDFLALAIPLWLVAFPALCLVAALAVLFECVGFLRGGLGNVAYFFLFMTALIFSVVSFGNRAAKPINDLFGMSYVISDMQRVAKVHDPDYGGEFSIGAPRLGQEQELFKAFGAESPTGAQTMGQESPLFHWPGVTWTAEMIAGRLIWVGVAILLALAAVLPFDRFDPAHGRLRPQPQARDEAPSPESLALEGSRSAPLTSLTPLVTQPLRPRLGRVLMAELRLMIGDCRWWWYVVIAGLNIAGLVVPGATVRQFLMAAAWLWPILLWSSMGTREPRHNMQQIVFSVAHPLARQLPAIWLAGVCVALMTGAGFAAQRVLAGQWTALAAWTVGALFIPSLALALGTWSSSSRLFEIVYLLLWYIGPMNRVPLLDYMGVTNEAVAMGIPLYYSAITVLLIGLSLIGRRRQIHL